MIEQGMRHYLPCLQVTSLAFTPDGQHLLSGDEEGTLIAWDLKQAKRVHSSKGHSGPVWSLATSHGSGAILASGDPPHATLAQHELHLDLTHTKIP
jgi:WD40 repeat protein